MAGFSKFHDLLRDAECHCTDKEKRWQGCLEPSKCGQLKQSPTASKIMSAQEARLFEHRRQWGAPLVTTLPIVRDDLVQLTFSQGPKARKEYVEVFTCRCNCQFWKLVWQQLMRVRCECRHHILVPLPPFSIPRYIHPCNMHRLLNTKHWLELLRSCCNLAPIVDHISNCCLS